MLEDLDWLLALLKARPQLGRLIGTTAGICDNPNMLEGQGAYTGRPLKC
jgi:hypothetical protein